MSNADKLEFLFELYSNDLARYAPTLEGQFGCPLCLRAVQRHEPLNCVVAEEHIVPSKLKGRATTLTCRKCNNSHGSSLESDLIQQVRIETGKKPLSARVEVGRGEFGASVFLPLNSETGDLEVEWIPKQSHPERLDLAKAQLLDGGSEVKMRLNYGYNEARARASLIRSAYLLMFRYFGYRYVLDVSASGLLEVIQDPFLESPAVNATNLRALDTLPDELRLPAIAIVREPEDRRSFIALLELDRETRWTVSIAVPPLGKNASLYYEELETMCEKTQLSLVIIPIPSRGFVPLAENGSSLADAT